MRQAGSQVQGTCKALEKPGILLPFVLPAFLLNNKHYAHPHSLPSRDPQVLRIRDEEHSLPTCRAVCQCDYPLFTRETLQLIASELRQPRIGSDQIGVSLPL